MSRWLAWTAWALVLVCFVASGMALAWAPERVVVHWSLTGQPDGYAPKYVGLFVLPGLMLVVLIALRLLPRIDPLRAHYREFATAYEVAILAVIAFLAAVQAVLLATALGARVNVGLVIAPLVGVLLMVVGAILAELRPNWFFGIRTPWTLSSERSWTATHRAGRWVFIVMGLAFVVAGVAQSAWSFGLAIAICVGGVLGLAVYSFMVWRDDPRRGQATPLHTPPG